MAIGGQRWRRWGRGLAAALATGMLGGPAWSSEALDPTKVVGPERCAECHQKELEAWRASGHARGFTAMHRSDRAQAMAAKLGVASIKRGSACAPCHYTVQGGATDAIAGVSCESCHGAAKDWIDVHGDYGGKGATKESESAEHRRQRIQESIARGMRRPDDPWALALRCHACHNVPQEKLVNQGGHLPGSSFELVSWMCGEVRHNFVGGASNREDGPERRRVLYVLGQVAALQTNLRDLALATEKATFAVKTARRVDAARTELGKINAVARRAEITDMLAAAQVDLKLDNAAALTRAAERVAGSAKTLAADLDGRALAGLDAMVPASAQCKGRAHP